MTSPRAFGDKTMNGASALRGGFACSTEGGRGEHAGSLCGADWQVSACLGLEVGSPPVMLTVALCAGRRHGCDGVELRWYRWGSVHVYTRVEVSAPLRAQQSTSVCNRLRGILISLSFRLL